MLTGSDTSFVLLGMMVLVLTVAVDFIKGVVHELHCQGEAELVVCESKMLYLLCMITGKFT